MAGRGGGASREVKFSPPVPKKIILREKPHARVI